MLQASAVLGDQKGISSTLSDHIIAQPGIPCERHSCCFVQRNETRFAELRLSNGKDAVLEIDIADIKGQRLPQSQTGRSEQPDECDMGLCA
jgi:hypothetical protein